MLTAIAVEVRKPRGYGRCRMSPLPDASRESLHAFVEAHVEPGSQVITVACSAYKLDDIGYKQQRRNQSAASRLGKDPGKLLPGVHRIASLIKRWLLGTHQGSVDDEHLPAYLDELVFRFNRRRSRSRGMLFYRVLELAIAHQPVRYRDLVSNKQPRKLPPKPPIQAATPGSSC